MMTVGLGVVGSMYSFGSEFTPAGRHPARPAHQRAEGVPRARRLAFETIDDLVTAWTADPGVASSSGAARRRAGRTHLFPMQLADEVGHRPERRQLRHLRRWWPAHQGAARREDPGRLLRAGASSRVRSSRASCGCSPSRARSATRRRLRRHSDPARVGHRPGLPELAGCARAPGISDERRDELIDYLEEMHDTPEWQAALESNGWTDDFMTGDEFGPVHRRAGRPGVRDARRTGADMSTQPPQPGDQRGRVDRSQYGLLAAALLAVGAYTIFDARGLNVGFGDPVGPRLFPYVIGTVTVVLAVLLAVATARGTPAGGRRRRRHRPDAPSPTGSRSGSCSVSSS